MHRVGVIPLYLMTQHTYLLALCFDSVLRPEQLSSLGNCRRMCPSSDSSFLHKAIGMHQDWFLELKPQLKPNQEGDKLNISLQSLLQLRHRQPNEEGLENVHVISSAVHIHRKEREVNVDGGIMILSICKQSVLTSSLAMTSPFKMSYSFHQG